MWCLQFINKGVKTVHTYHLHRPSVCTFLRRKGYLFSWYYDCFSSKNAFYDFSCTLFYSKDVSCILHSYVLWSSWLKLWSSSVWIFAHYKIEFFALKPAKLEIITHQDSLLCNANILMALSGSVHLLYIISVAPVVLSVTSAPSSWNCHSSHHNTMGLQTGWTTGKFNNGLVNYIG